MGSVYSIRQSMLWQKNLFSVNALQEITKNKSLFVLFKANNVLYLDCITSKSDGKNMNAFEFIVISYISLSLWSSPCLVSIVEESHIIFFIFLRYEKQFCERFDAILQQIFE